jgi:hypothetical protein
VSSVTVVKCDQCGDHCNAEYLLVCKNNVDNADICGAGCLHAYLDSFVAACMQDGANFKIEVRKATWK